ncbi:hypothetical protein C5B91_06555 [Haloferax sp. Atlit-10N]|uniref:Uncharacterized protein n=1 Tax=Haloferax prahovense (strain DSM 18310 / JCM 13924 / TL6) TaxID=1227461 RepID=M0GE20_HALPT|nr:hypothetical protein C457_08389 [Haloferax prahovense DSM 18310]RDZ45406.1 hypothetical protein C5B86_06555 [Haloferax sp. Atlit-19N]RDZ47319.1 hypothetical protein C5B87_06550 [Haloferax sp. Atlit-16N]RDZ61153.1 hypothetical protein C5B91_06555 [Haloferax sp. Atlit-10N]
MRGKRFPRWTTTHGEQTSSDATEHSAFGPVGRRGPALIFFDAVRYPMPTAISHHDGRRANTAERGAEGSPCA